MTDKPSRPKLAHALIPIIALVVGAVAATFLLGPNYDKFEFLYEDFSIDSCVTDFGVNESDFKAEPDQARSLHAICYEKIYSQGLLNEFQVRRVNFQQQHIADNIVMWMVVALTFSGVGLAALQITSSVKIYEQSGGDVKVDSTEVALEKGKIYLKSSVTGLFILLISFAFFYIYVLYVYTITEIGERSDSPPNQQVELGGVLVDGGFLPSEILEEPEEAGTNE